MRAVILCAGIIYLSLSASSQNIRVTTIAAGINASGGVTTDKKGNVYVSDFGEALGKLAENTNVYRLTGKSWSISTYASGFKGASGSCFDSKGNLFQSNPFGNRISKIGPDGKTELDWSVSGFKTPIGIVADKDDNLYVCNCSGNSISKISKDGIAGEFAVSKEFKCPNGLTIDPSGNLYACNFNDGKILKINPQGTVSVFTELPALTGGRTPVGNGHLTYKNGYLFAVTIGRGELYRVSMAGENELIAGIPAAFTNKDGAIEEATFCKPNGIAASITGDTLFINVSDAPWNSNTPLALYPAHLRMVTGINSLGKMRTQGHAGTSADQDDIDQIKTASKIFSGYYINGDYESLANAYTLDGKIFPDRAPIIEGRRAIRERWILPEGWKVIKHVATPSEIKIIGDHAYDYGYYEVESKKPDGSAVARKGKYVIVWRKEAGAWKIYLDIWNSVQE